MSDIEELTFEYEHETAIGQYEADMAVHAHTGDDCDFCRMMHTGQAAKALATATVNRDPEWWERSEKWLAGQLWDTRFTADDLVAAIGKPCGSTNQIGARLRSWAMAEAIGPVGFTEANRKESHGRVLRIWAVK